ncbi:hypothetical protein OH492_06135 [Vibrio chagasii]|nr:hypothetical protein [Vibrio chagasii]
MPFLVQQHFCMETGEVCYFKAKATILASDRWCWPYLRIDN